VRPRGLPPGGRERNLVLSTVRRRPAPGQPATDADKLERLEGVADSLNTALESPALQLPSLRSTTRVATAISEIDAARCAEWGYHLCPECGQVFARDRNDESNGNPSEPPRARRRPPTPPSDFPQRCPACTEREAPQSSARPVSDVDELWAAWQGGPQAVESVVVAMLGTAHPRGWAARRLTPAFTVRERTPRERRQFDEAIAAGAPPLGESRNYVAELTEPQEVDAIPSARAAALLLLVLEAARSTGDRWRALRRCRRPPCARFYVEKKNLKRANVCPNCVDVDRQEQDAARQARRRPLQSG
jgi:hypothetical protein